MAEFVDILNHLIRFEKNTINFVLDKLGNPWFFVRDILKILEYKDIKDVIKNNIKKENKTKIIKINKEYKTIFGSEMNPHTIFVNEFGLYDLILKSKMKKAEHFSIEMFFNISNFQKYMQSIYFFKKISDK
jgi:prophage antirepressor-like protein